MNSVLFPLESSDWVIVLILESKDNHKLVIDYFYVFYK